MTEQKCRVELFLRVLCPESKILKTCCTETYMIKYVENKHNVHIARSTEIRFVS